MHDNLRHVARETNRSVELSLSSSLSASVYLNDLSRILPFPMIAVLSLGLMQPGDEHDFLPARSLKCIMYLNMYSEYFLS